jgi:PAS domain S-box-containing protein
VDLKFASKLSALFLMILLAGMSAIGYLGYRATAGMLENDIRDQLEGNAFHTMDKIDRIFFERYADMRMLAADPVIGSRRSTPGRITERLRAIQGRSGQYASLAFFDLKRVRLADTSGSNIGVRHPFAEYWPDITAGRDFVMTIAESQTLKKVVIYFATVVKDARGIPFGVVAARMPIESLYEIAEQTLHKRRDREMLKVELWSREGLLLYSSYDTKRMLQGKAQDWEDLRESLSQGKTIGSVRHGYAGEEEISAFAREQGYREFKGNGWVLVICTPAKAAFAPARELGGRLLLIYIGIGFALVLAVFLVSRRVVRPLKELSSAAAEIGRGNLDIQVEAGSEDEVGGLARAFNKMAADLKESEAKYKNLAELLPQVVYEIDAKSNVVFVNHYGLKLFGYTQEDLDKGLNALQLFIPEDRDKVGETLRKGLRGEQLEDIEYLALRKDGTTFPFLTFAAPLLREGEIAGLRGIGIDITERKRTEEKIKKAEQEWERTFDAITAPIMMLDIHHRIIKANKSMANKLGVTPSEAIGLTCYKAVHGKNGPPEFCPHAKLLVDGQTHSTEIYEERLNGYYVITVSPLYTPEGKLYGSVHYAVDITERKQAEEALRAAADFSRTVMDSISDDISVIDVSDYRIIGCNAGYLKKYGLRTEDVVGKHCYEVSHRRSEPCLPPHDACPLKNTVTTGKFAAAEHVHFIKAGETCYVEVATTPVFNENGKVVQVVHVDRDITERKKAEEELVFRNTILATQQETTIDGILVVDENANIISYNRRFISLWGIPPEVTAIRSDEPTLQTVLTKVSEPEDFLEKVGYLYAHRDEKSHEEILLKDGRTFDRYSAPMVASSGRYYGRVWYFRDITERKRAENEIQKLNTELERKVEERTKQLLDTRDELVRKEKLATLGQLAGTVGHELRNPLGVMSNAVYFLQTVLPDADDVTKEYLGIIKSEIAGAERIVSDLLDAVRTKPPRPQLVLSEDLIRMSLEKYKIPERVRVEVLCATSRSVLIDPLQMKQVFINVISNGVDAMPEGGLLKITAEEDKLAKLVKFTFTDKGVGIAPENMAKLFQPLFTTKARGIGLGLVVVKNLTEANSGKVNVESEAGKGATFTVTLPAKGA